MDDGNLHLWECPHVLGGHNPEFERCGFISRGDKGGPGFCPYDHGENVWLVPLVATAQSADRRTGDTAHSADDDHDQRSEKISHILAGSDRQRRAADYAGKTGEPGADRKHGRE